MKGKDEEEVYALRYTRSVEAGFPWTVNCAVCNTYSRYKCKMRN